MSWIALRAEVAAEMAHLMDPVREPSPSTIRRVLFELDRRLLYDERRQPTPLGYGPPKRRRKRKPGTSARTRRRHAAIQRWLDERAAERQLKRLPAVTVAESRGLPSSRELARAEAAERDRQRQGPEPIWWTP